MWQTVLLSTFLCILSLMFGINFNYVPEPPDFDLKRWWGDGELTTQEDNTIRRFDVEINDTVINDLKYQLGNRRSFTPPMEGIQSQYGINTIYLDEILNYWRNEYNFKQRISRINDFPHYKTRIQGLDMHFIRIRPNVDGYKILPLLLLHGWPSSSAEFISIIPNLISPYKNYDFVFEVIAIDLPGFGLSQGTNKPGMNPVQIAVVIRNLMNRLGFEKYYIHAGDWGSQVASHMVTLFQQEVLGFHNNMPMSVRRISLAKQMLVALLPSMFVEEEYRDRVSFKNLLTVVIREMGYYHLQATKPDTIGASLESSPVALAAYVLEKIAGSTNRDQLNTTHGGLENLDINDVLDAITIMWVNKKVTTSLRLYAEAYAWEEVNRVQNIPTEVPTAAIKFLYEIIYQPDWILSDKYTNLVHSTTVNYGGHFAALQTPEILVEDIFASVQEFQNCHVRNFK